MVVSIDGRASVSTPGSASRRAKSASRSSGGSCAPSRSASPSASNASGVAAANADLDRQDAGAGERGAEAFDVLRRVPDLEGAGLRLVPEPGARGPADAAAVGDRAQRPLVFVARGRRGLAVGAGCIVADGRGAGRDGEVLQVPGRNREAARDESRRRAGRARREGDAAAVEPDELHREEENFAARPPAGFVDRRAAERDGASLEQVERRDEGEHREVRLGEASAEPRRGELAPGGRKDGPRREVEGDAEAGGVDARRELDDFADLARLEDPRLDGGDGGRARLRAEEPDVELGRIDGLDDALPGCLHARLREHRDAAAQFRAGMRGKARAEGGPLLRRERTAEDVLEAERGDRVRRDRDELRPGADLERREPRDDVAEDRVVRLRVPHLHAAGRRKVLDPGSLGPRHAALGRVVAERVPDAGAVVALTADPEDERIARIAGIRREIRLDARQDVVAPRDERGVVRRGTRRGGEGEKQECRQRGAEAARVAAGNGMEGGVLHCVSPFVTGFDGA